MAFKLRLETANFQKKVIRIKDIKEIRIKDISQNILAFQRRQSHLAGEESTLVQPLYTMLAMTLTD